MRAQKIECYFIHQKRLLDLGPGAIVGRKELATLLGVSPRSMPRIEQRQGFPKPLATGGGHKRWRLGDYLDWLQFGQIGHVKTSLPLVTQSHIFQKPARPQNYESGSFRYSEVRHAADASAPQLAVDADWIAFVSRLSTPTGRGDLSLSEYLRLSASETPSEKARARQAKNGVAWIPSTFGTLSNSNGNLRWADNVLSVSALVLDIDNADASKSLLQPEDVINSWPPELIIAWHTSYSHRPEQPRFRVVIPWATPISPQSHRQAFKLAQLFFKGLLDPVSESPSSIFFLPSCPADALSGFSSGVRGLRFAEVADLQNAWGSR